MQLLGELMKPCSSEDPLLLNELEGGHVVSSLAVEEKEAWDLADDRGGVRYGLKGRPFCPEAPPVSVLPYLAL